MEKSQLKRRGKAKAADAAAADDVEKDIFEGDDEASDGSKYGRLTLMEEVCIA